MLAPRFGPSSQAAIAEANAVAFVTNRQATALRIYESGRCDLVPCICDVSAKATCLQQLYATLFSDSGSLPPFSELLAVEYVSIGMFSTYHEALVVAEDQPCGKVNWPNLGGYFPTPRFACRTMTERRMLQAGLSPQPAQDRCDRTCTASTFCASTNVDYCTTCIGGRCRVRCFELCCWTA